MSYLKSQLIVHSLIQRSLGDYRRTNVAVHRLSLRIFTTRRLFPLTYTIVGRNDEEFIYPTEQLHVYPKSDNEKTRSLCIFSLNRENLYHRH